jgi:hypothetical protein
MKLGMFIVASALSASCCALTASGQTSIGDAGRSETLSISDGSLILCTSYQAIQTMHALVANGQVQNLTGCWVVDAPLEVIVLQNGPTFSSITFREQTDDAELARMIERGAPADLVERLRQDPWSPWYQRPAWAFTEWLRPSP